MKNRKLRLGSIVLLLPLMLSSCRSLRQDPYSRLGGVEDNNLDFALRRLGSGYDSENYRKFAPCLDDKRFVYAGAQFSELSFLRDQSASEILNETGGGLYAKASLFGLISAKVQGDMAASLASTDDSSAFIYQFNASGKSAIINDRRFNATGTDAFNRDDIAFYRSQCGNQFVERVRLGAQLFVGVKYTFTSKEQKEKVRLTIKASLFWGLIKFSKTWSKEWRDMLKNVRVSVEAFQIGGDPRVLEKLKASVYQGSCAGDNAERCSEAVDRLLEYGQNEFSEQLNGMALSDDPFKGPAILDVNAVDYSSESIFDPSRNAEVTVPLAAGDGPANDLAQALNKLENLRLDLKVGISRAKSLLDFNLSSKEKSDIEFARTELTNILKSLEETAIGTCKAALEDSGQIAACSSDVGTLSQKAEKSLKPLEIPNRL